MLRATVAVAVLNLIAFYDTIIVMDIRLEKPKLKISEQIAHMKKSGITFKYISETAVEKYLLEYTYYFKLKACAKNYARRKASSSRKAAYICLDFSYLQELARLDMHFREIVFKITVDIEHLLKVHILSNSQRNNDDDGYQIVEDFLLENPDIHEKLEKYSTNSYNAALIQKYQSCFPLWVFVEIIQFGDLIKFYNFYISKYPATNNVSKYLWSARILRNAAAHNSCVLNRLSEKFDESKINNSLMNTLKRNYLSLNSSKIKKYLLNPVIQDFIGTLILLKKLDKSKSLLERRMKEIDVFMRRCRKHATYYKNNTLLFSVYKFVYDFLSEYKQK